MVKSQSTGQYRNLQQTDGAETYEFEVKTSKGWIKFGHLAGDCDEDRQQFAQKTADAWRKK